MATEGMLGFGNGFRNVSPESAPHGQRSYNVNPQSFVLTGQAILVALLILFSVVVLFLLLHIYARCLLLLHRRSVRLRRSRGLLHDPDNPTSSSAAARGLDASVLASLPVFVFSAETHGTQMLDCAVCLSEFEENEKGRLLPKCNHSFHIDCIDMWFHSHSTCPLCRDTVLPESPKHPLPLSAIRVDENPELGSGSGFSSSCRVEGETEPSSSSSLSGGAASIRMKGLEIAVGTSRGESLRGSEGVEIAAVSPGKLKSPGSRILSLKRMFSGDRRAGAFSTSGSSSFAQVDLERGEAQS